MRYRALLACLVASLFFGLVPALPTSAASCQFVLGFASLHNTLPGIVGDCLDNEYHNPQNGDALQNTTRGLLVWRKADNVTAFTDGARTWVSGPFGVQQRLNDQRFAWEWNPDGMAVVPAPVAGDRCHTGGLSLDVRKVAVKAGDATATISLTNNLKVPCTLSGFVGAEMLDAQSNRLPTSVVPGSSDQPSLPGPQTVPAGASATFKMQWTSSSASSEATCPVATQLKVTPPGEFDAIIIPVKMSVCGDGRLAVSAVTTSLSVSHNWSGYVATGGSFTSVTGTWVVPALSSTGRAAAGATWVGIGGVLSDDLIQAGTEDVSTRSGQAQYGAFIETLPLPAEPLDMPINPGDSVTVTITQQDTGQWLVSLTNNTTGDSFQTGVQYPSSLSSAEWVQEAPSTRRGIVPLANFGTVQFSDATTVEDGQTLTAAEAGAQPITMIDVNGNTIAQASALTASGSGFSVSRVFPTLAGVSQ